MNIVIRADASNDIGTGHVMRCLTLAGTLKERGADIIFVCRAHLGNLCNYIESSGFKLIQLPFGSNRSLLKKSDFIKNNFSYSDWLGVSQEEDAKQSIEAIKSNAKIDLIIVDHYALDQYWHRLLRPYVKQVMVIDDLANRQYDCDLLLDQNYFENMDQRYENLIPKKCKKYYGPSFALLRREFISQRRKLKRHRKTVKRILVQFGGCDQTNETTKALEAIRTLNDIDIVVDVVVGASNPHKNEIRNLCNEMYNTNYHCQVDNISELMSLADLAIGTGGGTTWERCFLGLPTIMWTVAENQLATSLALGKKGAVWMLGTRQEVDVGRIVDVLNTIIKAPSCLEKMSKITEGLFGDDFERNHNLLIETIMDNTKKEYCGYNLRPIEERDLGKVLEWRNSDRVRANMYTDHIITKEEHRGWFDKIQKSDTDVCLIFEVGQKPIGLVSFSKIDKNNARCHWGFYIGESKVPLGIGAVLEILTLDYAFNTLRIDKLCGEVLAFNQSVVDLHKNFGFTVEGRLVKHIIKKGIKEDVVLIAMFQEQWRKSRENFVAKLPKNLRQGFGA